MPPPASPSVTTEHKSHPPGVPGQVGRTLQRWEDEDGAKLRQNNPRDEAQTVLWGISCILSATHDCHHRFCPQLALVTLQLFQKGMFCPGCAVLSSHGEQGMGGVRQCWHSAVPHQMAMPPPEHLPEALRAEINLGSCMARGKASPGGWVGKVTAPGDRGSSGSGCHELTPVAIRSGGTSIPEPPARLPGLLWQGDAAEHRGHLYFWGQPPKHARGDAPVKHNQQTPPSPTPDCNHSTLPAARPRFNHTPPLLQFFFPLPPNFFFFFFF